MCIAYDGLTQLDEAEILVQEGRKSLFLKVSTSLIFLLFFFLLETE